jgi:phosphoribosylamine-glycine ligase
MLDLNVIVAKDSIYGLEFTPRFGYDATPTFLYEVVTDPLGEFLGDIAHGTLRGVNLASDNFAGAIRVTIPPWPSERYHAEENIPIRGLTKGWERNTYLYNVKENEEGDLVSAGAWGILLLLTSSGNSIVSAMRQPLERAKELRIKNKQFRTDLVDRFKEDMKKLEVTLGVH